MTNADILLLALGGIYFLYSLYISIRILRADYSDASRKPWHILLTWLLPFFGGYLLRSFWNPKQADFEIVTREKRKRDGAGWPEAPERTDFFF